MMSTRIRKEASMMASESMNLISARRHLSINFLLADVPDERSCHETSNRGELEHGEGEELVEQVDVEECLSEGASSEDQEDENFDIEPTSKVVHQNQHHSRSGANLSKLNIILSLHLNRAASSTFFYHGANVQASSEAFEQSVLLSCIH